MPSAVKVPTICSSASTAGCVSYRGWADAFALLAAKGALTARRPLAIGHAVARSHPAAVRRHWSAFPAGDFGQAVTVSSPATANAATMKNKAQSDVLFCLRAILPRTKASPMPPSARRQALSRKALAANEIRSPGHSPGWFHAAKKPQRAVPSDDCEQHDANRHRRSIAEPTGKIATSGNCRSHCISNSLDAGVLTCPTGFAPGCSAS